MTFARNSDSAAIIVDDGTDQSVIRQSSISQGVVDEEAVYQPLSLNINVTDHRTSDITE